MKQSRSAFTLIELLVVIAIIAILAAILFPVFAQAKESAKMAVTLSNLDQAGLAQQMYIADTDDNFPRTRYSLDGINQNANYKHSIYPYMKNSQMMRDLTNPAASLPDCEGDPNCVAGGVVMASPIFSRGYFYYRPFFITHAWQDQSPYNESMVDQPANSLLLAEDKDVYADYGPWMSYIVAGTNGWAYSNWGGGHRDDHGFTVDFVDGHAKFEPMRASCGAPGSLNQWQYDPAGITNGEYSNWQMGTGPADITWINTFCSTLPF